MASLEFINFQHKHEIHYAGKIIWETVEDKKQIKGLPQIIWSDNTPWREANLWAAQRATTNKTNLKTVVSLMKHVHAYANWLENEDIS